MACPFCELAPDDPLFLRSFTYWRILVSLQQHNLGALIIALKRHTPSLADIEFAELFELRRAVIEAERTLKKAFGCSHVNYLFLNDRILHLKCHVVPRYAAPVEFFNRVWKDDNFGHRPMLTALDAPQDALAAIREKLAKNWQDA